MISNFLFHRVNPERDKLWDPMDPVLFEKCMKYISQNYEVVLLEELIISNNIHPQKKYATIMFDDGYKDNIEFAAPILEKFKCKASFYVVTDCIDNNIPTWTHILEHLFQFTKKTEILIDFVCLPAELKITHLKTPEAKIEYIKKLKPVIKNLSHTDRASILDRIVKTYSDVALPKLMMNWTDIQKLRRNGHYIGSHTSSHCMLGTMDNKQEIKDELLNSGKKIEEKLGYFPISVSYPVGSFNDQTIQIAKATGYKIGLAVKQNIYNQEKDGLFEISRIELYNESWWKTKMRISNRLESIKKLIRYK